VAGLTLGRTVKSVLPQGNLDDQILFKYFVEDLRAETESD